MASVQEQRHFEQIPFTYIWKNILEAIHKFECERKKKEKEKKEKKQVEKL